MIAAYFYIAAAALILPAVVAISDFFGYFFMEGGAL